MLPFEDRFTRQRQLREVGFDGQERLQSAVVVLGDSASEGVAADYLRRAGVRVSPAAAAPAQQDTSPLPEAAKARIACSYRGPSDYLAGALLALRHVRSILELEAPAARRGAPAAELRVTSHRED